ncbi:TetR/AcrR family transcriptional regulator [Kitasatospora cheerisanensis]|uniref:TetR family transcriptional regulator n=1 Tax=Kitasatospora cheerisanensis KCTC 2395 TaxID=1348663 RepID=A0A066Z397_9ACTN|nr:TetR/AcrR family transcriptional regulator [Kitasatospora cheerisanensis]KDN84831.1 TetR family transcriptional regulator [Kitasatospora cheerisanensis KCTC 2395]
MSAEERRESVVRAAVLEFARGGYRGTSTEAIARRVGVSQPYLFRLFPNKQAIFEAACEHCVEETWRVFDRASEGLTGEAARVAMSEAYMSLVEDREQLMMQMQMYVSVFAAESAGEDRIGDAARTAWLRLFERIRERMGGDQKEATQFMAYGMLINTLVGLGYPPDHRIWSGFEEYGERAGES